MNVMAIVDLKPQLTKSTTRKHSSLLCVDEVNFDGNDAKFETCRSMVIAIDGDMRSDLRDPSDTCPRNVSIQCLQI